MSDTTSHTYPKSPATATVGRKFPYALRTPHRAGPASFKVCRYVGLYARAWSRASWRARVTVGAGRGVRAVSALLTVVVSWASRRGGAMHTTARRPSQRFIDDSLCAGDVTGAQYGGRVAQVSVCDTGSGSKLSRTSCQGGSTSPA